MFSTFLFNSTYDASFRNSFSLPSHFLPFGLFPIIRPSITSPSSIGYIVLNYYIHYIYIYVYVYIYIRIYERNSCIATPLYLFTYCTVSAKLTRTNILLLISLHCGRLYIFIFTPTFTRLSLVIRPVPQVLGHGRMLISLFPDLLWGASKQSSLGGWVIRGVRWQLRSGDWNWVVCSQGLNQPRSQFWRATVFNRRQILTDVATDEEETMVASTCGW